MSVLNLCRQLYNHYESTVHGENKNEEKIMYNNGGDTDYGIVHFL